MSYVDAPSRWNDVARNGLDHFPRIALLATIVLAWVMTLAWPPAPADFQPRVASAKTQDSDYILRIALPETEPVAAEELAELVKQHDSLAKLDLDLPRTGSSRFEGAFSDFLSPNAVIKPPPKQDLKPGEFLNLDYDINTLEPASETFDRGGSLTVKKPLFVNGISSGSATIRIEEGAQILIATSAVARALGDRTEELPSRISGALAQGNGFIPFYELRGAGIAVEYDPVADRISLSMPS